MSKIFKDIVKIVDKYNRIELIEALKKAEGISIRTTNIAEYAYYDAILNICKELIIMREVLHSEFPEEGEEAITQKLERIHCSMCGKSVSTPISRGTEVRAYIKCPECIEKEEDEKL